MGGIYARAPVAEALGAGGLTIVVAAIAGAAIMLALMLLRSAQGRRQRCRRDAVDGAVQTQHMLVLEADVERLRAELGECLAEAERSREELQAFASAVSHDLQAPLRHIGSFTQILVSDLGASLEEADRSNLEFVTSTRAVATKSQASWATSWPGCVVISVFCSSARGLHCS